MPHYDFSALNSFVTAHEDRSYTDDEKISLNSKSKYSVHVSSSNSAAFSASGDNSFLNDDTIASL